MLDHILTWGVVVLPFLFAVGIEVIDEDIRKRSREYRIGVIAFGVVISGATWFQMSRADAKHENDNKNQHIDIENLRGDLRKSETERQIAEAYLKAKLEDSYQMNAQLAQLGPALMKLATVSANFEQKQYEAKTTSNKELFEFTMGVVHKIREFSDKYKALQAQEIHEMMATSAEPQSDAERQRRWNESTQREIQLYYNRDSEFRSSILPDALYAKNEMTKKAVPEPSVSPTVNRDVDMVLKGILAGPYPELTLADYLELRAREIRLKK